ncbi:hypothetical protein QBC36DRAFT_360387 [Triangularia setosa]|uniref:CENP-V/GFA domain-containing protein n=1 Tax=Triangularia setosa TaxID=2587417 RepID=A0AAN6W0R7_9PEZI|nr:hypothetical protein QBC36DRAFT_360387 [Podospora setosa]
MPSVSLGQLIIIPQTLPSFVLPSARDYWKLPGTTTLCYSSSNSRLSAAPYGKMQVSCQCTSIAFPLTAPLLDLYHCHCLECQKQSSSAFGTSVIFPSFSFTIPAETRSKLSVWTRPTKEDRSMDCYFCKEYRCRIYHHIREVDGTLRSTVSVKGGVIPDGVEKLEGAPGGMVGRGPETKERK